MLRSWAALAWIALVACDCGDDPRAGSRRFGDDEAGVRLDSGAHDDASEAGEDGGAERDTGSPDRSAGSDAGDVDAGPRDGAFDSGPNTGGDDAGPDAGAFDSGSDPDAGVLPDGGAPSDAGVADSGSGTGDLWIEIDYRGASSPQSPLWSSSNTPGWAASDWAFTGGGCCAEAWDRFNNMSVVNDPIGESLEIHPSAQLQLMFGIVRLTGYTAVTVELEGRSRATSAFVQFAVTNPANGCGIGGLTMDQDWTADVVVVDMTPCLDLGSMLQAIRVEPTGGSSTIALLRMRLTIHGALF